MTDNESRSEEPAMTTIAIVPEGREASPARYRAVAGHLQTVGSTVGQALDALTAQLDEPKGTTLVIVQHGQPDQFFTAIQQQRLEELMARWRTARDSGATLPTSEQTELDTLVEAEQRAALQRTAALVQGLTP
jgi:hypothetical protein